MNDAQESSPLGLDFNYIVWVAKRRKGVIALSTLLGLLASYLFTTLVPPKYAASSQLLFDAAAEQLVTIDPEFKAGWGGQNIFASSAAMIESPGVLKPVALKLIANHPQPSSQRTPIQTILADADLSDADRLAALISVLQKNLTVKTQAADQVILVEYKSPSADEAAFLANLISVTFLEGREAKRKEAFAQATEWLDQRSTEAKDKLIAVDKKIQDFKAGKNIEATAGIVPMLDADLGRKREQLSALEARLAEAISNYEAFTRYAGADRSYDKIPDNVGGPTFERLRTSLAEALRDLASIKSRLGGSHPDVHAKESSVAAIRAEMDTFVQGKKESLNLEIGLLKSRVAAFREEIKNVEAQSRSQRVAEVQLQQLTQERDAIKTLYDTMLGKLMQMNMQRTLNFAQFKPLLDATVPTSPKLPRWVFWGAGLLGGLLMGLLASLLQDKLNGRVVMFDQAKKQLPVKLITQVPLITASDFNGSEPSTGEDYKTFAKKYPRSLFANKLVAAQLVVRSAGVDGKCRVVMVTSPTQGDGKSFITANLASLSSYLGQKTLLIDFDARRMPVTNGVAHEPSSESLAEFYSKNNLETVFSPPYLHEKGEYDVLRVHPSSEIASLRFFQTKGGELLNFARENYDHVWIDTPPVRIFNDPLIIAKPVDGFMVVAEWSKTTMKQITDTVSLIKENNGKVLGVILNKVKVDRLISDTMASYENYYIGSNKAAS